MNQKGFSLLELMIVVAIIGILTLIAYPFYQDYVARVTVAQALAETNDIKNQLSNAYMEGGVELLEDKIDEINYSTNFEWAVVNKVFVRKNGWSSWNAPSSFSGYAYKIYFKEGALPYPFDSSQRSISVAMVMNRTYLQCKDSLCGSYMSSDPGVAIKVADNPIMFCGQGRESDKVMYENIPRRWLPAGCKDAGIEYGDFQKDGALEF